MFFLMAGDSTTVNETEKSNELQNELDDSVENVVVKRIKPLLEKLEIKKFRDIPAGMIPLGTAITALAGRNATGKSTILGMLGQPFGGRGSNLTDLFGNLMATKFSQILKMDAETAGDHEYILYFYDPIPPYKELDIPVKSKLRNRLSDGTPVGLRFVTGRTHRRGEGNLDVPVAYLGLRRLDPIGENKKISHVTAELSSTEISYFNDAYMKIMGDTGASQSCNLISGQSGKKTLSITPQNYSPLSISAGQDNIGRILAAIISLQRLKNDPIISYYGGLVLIDELDASLHPASLYTLVDCMYDWSKQFGIQFVFSTHSLDLLDYLYRHKRNKVNSTAIVYFSRPYGKVEIILQPTPNQINTDLKLQRPNYGNESTVSVYCEDSVARKYLDCLIRNSKTSNYIRIIETRDYGAGELYKAAWAFRSIPELERAIFVVDGDKANLADEKKNIVVLPGGNAPELVALQYIKSNRPDNPVFKKHPHGLTFSHLSAPIPLEETASIGAAKRWFALEFNDETQLNWLWESYIQDNAEVVQTFHDAFKIALNQALRAAHMDPVD